MCLPLSPWYTLGHARLPGLERSSFVFFCFLSGWKMDIPGSPLLIGRSLSGVSPPHPRECLLDLYAELDSLGAAHPHAVHTRHHQTHTCDLPNVSPSRRTRRIEERTREGRGERHVLWLNSSFSIAFVQYWLKKEKKKKVNFYFISQSSRWGQLYRTYRVHMALRHLIVGLPNSFCK